MIISILFSIIVKPFIVVIYLFLFIFRKATLREFLEKNGWLYGSKNSIEGEYLWFHLSSLGEYQNSIFTIKKISDKTGKKVLLTCFHKDVLKLAMKNNHIQQLHFIPFESLTGYLRLIRRYNIKNIMIFETEIWPLLLSLCRYKKISSYLLNGYLYEKDYLSYRRFLFLFKNAFSSFKLLAVQSAADKKRFTDLGAIKANIKICGDLKYDISFPQYSSLTTLRKKYNIPSGHKILTAASIHKGEEKILIPVFKELLSVNKKVIIIIAPRYLDLVPSIEKELTKSSLEYVNRSRSKKNVLKNSILILDTIGELREVFPFSDLVFMGGSLIPHGGHNILEPIYYNKRTFSGKHYFHFSDMYAKFKKYVDVVESENLGSFIKTALVQKRKDNGKKLLSSLKGASDSIVKMF